LNLAIGSISYEDMWLGASLLDRGVDVNAQADGFIAVNMAATMGQPEAVRFLIARTTVGGVLP
jgi:hypothetical protein